MFAQRCKDLSEVMTLTGLIAACCHLSVYKFCKEPKAFSRVRSFLNPLDQLLYTQEDGCCFYFQFLILDMRSNSGVLLFVRTPLIFTVLSGVGLGLYGLAFLHAVSPEAALIVGPLAMFTVRLSYIRILHCT